MSSADGGKKKRAISKGTPVKPHTKIANRRLKDPKTEKTIKTEPQTPHKPLASTMLLTFDSHAADISHSTHVQSEMYHAAREGERSLMSGDGEPMKTAKVYVDLKEERMKAVNAMHHINIIQYENPKNQVPTDAIHVATSLMDRFAARYNGQNDYSMLGIAAAALHMASKYGDVEPVDVERLIRNNQFGQGLKKLDMVLLEKLIEEHVADVPKPATSFVLCFLQAVNLETMKAAVHTARYFCALGAAEYELTGHFHSKIAAAATFIAYNRYAPSVNQSLSTSVNTMPPAVEFPESLKTHSGYSLEEIELVVMKLLSVAKIVEMTCKEGVTDELRCQVPVDVYLNYRRVNLTTTFVLPDFKSFFAGLKTDACSDKTAHSKPSSPTVPDEDTKAVEEEDTDEAKSA